MQTELSNSDYQYLRNFGSSSQFKKYIDDNYPKEFQNGDYESFRNFVGGVNNKKPPIWLFSMDCFKFLTSNEQNNFIKTCLNLAGQEDGILLFDTNCLCHYKIGKSENSTTVEFIISLSKRYPGVYYKVVFGNDNTHDISIYELRDGAETNMAAKEFALNFSKFILFFNIYTEHITQTIYSILPNKKLKTSKSMIRNKLDSTVFAPSLDVLLEMIAERGDDFSKKEISFSCAPPDSVSYKIVEK